MNNPVREASKIVQEMVDGYGDKFPGLSVLFDIVPSDEQSKRCHEPIPALGRYQKNVIFLEDVTSGKAIGLTRFKVAKEYLRCLNEFLTSYEGRGADEKIVSHLADDDIQAIMLLGVTAVEVFQAEQIESVTEHDTAAATDYLKLLIATRLPHLAPYIEAVHFACTSEDNMGNVYGLIGNRLVFGYFFDAISDYCLNLIAYSRKHSRSQQVPLYLPALTHQQAAEPISFDIIQANTIEGILKIMNDLTGPSELTRPFSGKLGGATGTLICHYAAYPDADWHTFAHDFVIGLGLSYSHRTYQCVTYAREIQIFVMIANILTLVEKATKDFISHASCPAQFFVKQKKAGSKGSSIMPNKSNAWSMEGAIPMLREARSALFSIAESLPVYPHQGDMARSYIFRNLGSAFMPIFIALNRITSEMNSYVPNLPKINAFFHEYPGMSGSALQTVLKRMKIPGDAYREIQEISINHDGSYANHDQFRSGLEAKIEKFNLSSVQRDELLNLLNPGYLLKEAQSAAEDDLDYHALVLEDYKILAAKYSQSTY